MTDSNPTYYDPQLTLTHVGPAARDYRLDIKVYYPAGETGTIVSNVVVGSDREITIDVVLDPNARNDHFVTSAQAIQRETGENEITVTVKKDGKKKGEGIVIYSTGKRLAA